MFTNEDFILSMLDEEDIEGEYIYPISSLVLTIGPNFVPKIELKLSYVVETEL